MSKMRGQDRSPFALCIVMVCFVLAGSPSVFALNPKLDVSQYAHNAWRVREGFTKSPINSIAQTPDGYLWLGTDLGLMRFDGARTVPWQPPFGQHLLSNAIRRLLGARDGTLWIGTDRGLASWKTGKLTNYEQLAGIFIFSILEDRDGTVWAGGLGVPSGRLCAIQNGSIHCNDSLGPAVFGMYEDGKGSLWLGVLNGLWRWKPGTPNFYSMPDAIDSIHAFAEDDTGALLFTTRAGLKRLVEGKIEPYSLPGNLQEPRVYNMLRDHDGGLWLATSAHGIVHVHQNKVDVFAQANGLSGNLVFALFEDREGSVWAVTGNGLDQFRELAVPSVSRYQGLNADVWSVLAARDGTVWLGTLGGLQTWNKGQITIAPTGSAKQDGKLNGDVPNSLFQDSRGRIWISTLHGFGYLENARYVQVQAVPGGMVHSIAEDKAGNIWIANQDSGLFRLSPRGELRQIPWASLGRGFAYSLTGDASRDGVWLGFYKGGVAYFSDGAVRESYSVADGLGEGMVQALQFDREGTLWAATEGGLSRLKNGRVATLNSRDGLPCDGVHWIVDDDDHWAWLHMACGLVRVARSEIDAWSAAVDRALTQKDDHTTQFSIRGTVFGSSDGVITHALAGGFKPLVAKSSDGKLWFPAAGEDMSVLDPKHLPSNGLPPPVHIEQIIADRKPYDLSTADGKVRLPPRIRDLQIDYTGLSFVAPDKVLFRYKLEGWDRDWQDAGTRRQAFYSNLPPRNYTFRVMACNNSGVWNEAGTFLNFSVAPAYYQTLWFRSLCVIAFLGSVAALYEFRLRQVARQFSIRMEERINERTRVARDLHDTLLQSFQGVLLKFHAITYLLPGRPDEAQKNLEAVIEQAREAITEGRDAVHGLRSSAVGTSDLAQTIGTFGNGLAGVQSGEGRPEFGLQVEGSPRDLAPLLCDEVYRLTAEALRNAFKHSNARRIEVEIRYDRRQFRLRVRDNGKGIESNMVGGDGRAGHFGLPGMHERAKLAGGKLSVWSEIDSGTEVELTIPGAVAYAKSPAARRPMFFRRGA